MNTPPWFPFYPCDWLSSAEVICMTPEQRGAYIQLLAHAWQNTDCGIPDDPERLAVLSGLGDRWNTCSTFVQHVFKKRGGRLYNERLLSERKICKEITEKKRAAGIASGKSRRTKKLSNEHPFNTCSTPVEQNTNQSHSQSHSQSQVNTDTPISPSEQSETLPGIEPVTESKPKEKPLTPERVMRAWNRMAETCESPMVEKLSAAREKSLRARIKDSYFRENWLRVLHVIAETPFLQGKNDRSWKCDFDWYINETNFVKIAEGKYKIEKYEPDTCTLTHEEIQASFALAEKQRQAAIAAGLCNEKGELLIPEYEELTRYKAELEAHRAEN